MLSQPVQHGSLKLPSSSPLYSWSRDSAKQPGRKVAVIARIRISEEHFGVTNEKERIHSVKDVWRPKRTAEHLQKCSEAAESTSYVKEAIHKDRLREQLTYPSTNSTLSTCNGLFLANVGDTTGLCDTSRMESEKSSSRKPSQRGNDVWRAEKQNGSTGMKTGALRREVDAWMADKRTSPAGHASRRDRTTNGKRTSSGSDVRRARITEDGPTMNTRSSGHCSKNRDSRKRLYLVDIHALCYEGNKVQPGKVVEWLKLLFADVTEDNPIIAVMDGERGNEYRRKLLPNYKAKRNFYRPLAVGNGHSSAANDLRRALPLIHGFLTLCHIPVVKAEFAEADDVIASLTSQARGEGFQVVIASPDMDFKQLLSPDVHMLLPLPELGRWSFYTLQHYVSQNTVTPDLELGLKCMLGDVSDNVFGLSDVAPGFGRKTALKLMQKHGSLEKLLAAAATRTVGREYIQDALTKHADLLRRNLQVLSLRTDVEIALEEQWCRPRCLSNDVLALELLNERLQSG